MIIPRLNLRNPLPQFIALSIGVKFTIRVLRFISHRSRFQRFNYFPALARPWPTYLSTEHRDRDVLSQSLAIVFEWRNL